MKTNRQVRSDFDLRMRIETHLVREIIRRFNVGSAAVREEIRQHVQILIDTNEAMQLLLQADGTLLEKDAIKSKDLGTAFHRTIARAAGYPGIEKLVADLKLTGDNELPNRRYAENHQQIIDEHNDVVVKLQCGLPTNRISRKDRRKLEKAAAKSMATHLRSHWGRVKRLPFRTPVSSGLFFSVMGCAIGLLGIGLATDDPVVQVMVTGLAALLFAIAVYWR